jgi:hypothetical protein
MTSPSLIHGWLAVSLSLALALSGCCGTSLTDEDGTGDPRVDPALNGAWVDGVQSGLTYVYITELRFDNGNFEWTWDDQLQQRGVYDTQDGILTVTILHNYGSPQRFLAGYSRPYSIAGDTLTWGGGTYTKK